MCRFLLDVGLHDHEVSLKSASERAAAVLWLTRCVLGNPSYDIWRKQLHNASLYTPIHSDYCLKNSNGSFPASSIHNDPLHPEALSV